VGPAGPRVESAARRTGRRIVLTTFGSLGDLYPYLAIALGLQARGHEAVIATTRHYRQRIEARGVGFHAVRPDGPDLDTDRAAMRRIMDARRGTEYVVRDLLLPALRESYEDLLAATQGADLLVSHVLTYAARLVAEKHANPWASGFLQPLGFFSAYDPPVLPQMPWLARLRFLGPVFHRPFFGLAKWSCRSWAAPWHALRAAIGLPPTSDHPLFEGLYSPSLVLALFSPLFADKQPDWPPQTVVTGFPFLDESAAVLASPGSGDLRSGQGPGSGDPCPAHPGLSPELVRFLDAGPPPVVFTLGSSGSQSAGAFYERSAAAAKLLGRRAILIVGKDQANRPASLPDGVVAFEYAPFLELFPRSAAIVHAGGIGTTGLAMRSGRPMLVMPYAHDQFDNAARATRLGIARAIPERRYLPARVSAELGQLLEDPLYGQRASVLGERIRSEDGVRAACDAIDGVLGGGTP
jgi:UDP:flavonoid glycosyltransferase YjiC (YdhE family)